MSRQRAQRGAIEVALCFRSGTIYGENQVTPSKTQPGSCTARGNTEHREGSAPVGGRQAETDPCFEAWSDGEARKIRSIDWDVDLLAFADDTQPDSLARTQAGEVSV